MQIKNFAQLSKIADICRKKGIETIKITPESVEFTLKEEVLKRKSSKKSSNGLESDEIALDDQPSEEDMLFWSSTGIADSATNGQG